MTPQPPQRTGDMTREPRWRELLRVSLGLWFMYACLAAFLYHVWEHNAFNAGCSLAGAWTGWAISR